MKRKKKKTFLDYFSNKNTAIILFVLMIILGIYDVYFTEPIPFCINGNLAQRGYFPNYSITIDGYSMSPTLQRGQDCFCSIKENYSVGDIVMYNGSFLKEYYGLDSPVIHRIIGENALGEFVTKGDNSTYIDYFLISKDDILCSIPTIPRYKL